MKSLWTKRNIMDYLSHPDESLDKNYCPLRQKYRKELRRMDEETKKMVLDSPSIKKRDNPHHADSQVFLPVIKICEGFKINIITVSVDTQKFHHKVLGYFY